MCLLNQLVKNYNKPTRPWKSRTCPIKAKLEQYKQRCIDTKLSTADKAVLMDYNKEMQKILEEKDATLRLVKGNITDLKANLEVRERQRLNQDETICVLQNSLKMCEKEIEALRTKLTCLEVEKCEIEKDSKKQILNFQNKICELQKCLKQSEESTIKHKKAEADLQIEITNLKANESKCREELCDKQKELLKVINTLKLYKDQCKDTTADLDETKLKLSESEKKVKDVLEECKRLQSELKQKNIKIQDDGNLEKIKDLKGQVKYWTVKNEELESKLIESEKKQQTMYSEYNELKSKVLEKETTVEKLQLALTQLSNKVASSRLDKNSSISIKHYQEECARFQALFNTTACKLELNEIEMALMMQENNRIKCELEQCTSAQMQQKKEESCPFLLERVKQLAKELQIADSCKNDYAVLINELKEKCAKREEENTYLQSRLQQLSQKNGKLLQDLENANEEITRLEMKNSDLCNSLQKLQESKLEMARQIRKMQKIICESQSTKGGLEPNIEVQREISTALSNQLRIAKGKLSTITSNYRDLKTAHEDLKKDYKLLRKRDQDLGLARDRKTHCAPCEAKASKFLGHKRYSEEMRSKVPNSNYLHSKSCHKIHISDDLRQQEKKWKQKVREVIQFEKTPAEAIYSPSSSN